MYYIAEYYAKFASKIKKSHEKTCTVRGKFVTSPSLNK